MRLPMRRFDEIDSDPDTSPSEKLVMKAVIVKRGGLPTHIVEAFIRSGWGGERMKDFILSNRDDVTPAVFEPRSVTLSIPSEALGLLMGQAPHDTYISNDPLSTSTEHLA